VNFVNHCYVDTEVEMKEIYTSNHIWKLFDNFLVDMSSVRLCQTERSCTLSDAILTRQSRDTEAYSCVKYIHNSPAKKNDKAVMVRVSLFSLFLKVCNTTTDRNHADLALEKYVTETVMGIIKGFFSSPFSVNHSNLQVLLSQ